jgi:hypothetical protein
MGQCQSIKTLTLQQIALDEDHFRVLGAYSRLGLRIKLNYCKMSSVGTSAFVELLPLISSAVNNVEDRGTGDCCTYHLDLL